MDSARKELLKQKEEWRLLTKWGMVNKQSIDIGAATIPEGDNLIEFRCVKLGKKDVVVWSAKTYEHTAARARGGRGRAGRGVPRPERVLKAIALKVSRDDWVDMVNKYDAVHETTPNPPLMDEAEEAFNPEVEGETAATRRKKNGLMYWARVMIALNDIEMHKLMAVGQGRTNSSDPRASLDEKKKRDQEGEGDQS